MASRLYQIPERQREVMGLLVQGMKPLEIAKLLGVLPKTVYEHRKQAIASLGARDLAEAIAIFRDLRAEAERMAA